MGVCIDIFPLDEVPGAESARRMHDAAQRVHGQMQASAALDENQGGELPDFKAEKCYGMGGVARLYLLFAERYEWVCSRYKDGPYYTIPVLASERGAWLYDKQWFASSGMMEFEGLKIPVPEKWSEVLVASYPDGLLEPERVFGKQIQAADDAIIDMSRPYKEYVSRYTDMLCGIEGKRVFIFGAGDSLRIWLERYSGGCDVVCAVDNSKSKWGTTAYGMQVRSPKELPELLDKDSRLIIASVYHKEIGEQLANMGINDYFIFVDGWNYRKDPE